MYLHIWFSCLQITPEKFEKLSADILGIIGQGSPTIFKGVILLVRIYLIMFLRDPD